MFCNFDRETHQQKKMGVSFRVIWGSCFCRGKFGDQTWHPVKTPSAIERLIPKFGFSKMC